MVEIVAANGAASGAAIPIDADRNRADVRPFLSRSLTGLLSALAEFCFARTPINGASEANFGWRRLQSGLRPTEERSDVASDRSPTRLQQASAEIRPASTIARGTGGPIFNRCQLQSNRRSDRGGSNYGRRWRRRAREEAMVKKVTVHSIIHP